MVFPMNSADAPVLVRGQTGFALFFRCKLDRNKDSTKLSEELMKFNKWTIALAAVGVVSLASAARAEEKASSVMTALSSTTLSGYVDTSAQWNFGTGNGRLPDYKFGGSSKADGFNLNVVQIRLEKPLDEAEWAAGYRVDLWAGPDAK